MNNYLQKSMRFYREKLKAASRPMYQREVLDSVHYLNRTTYNKKVKLPYHEEPLLLRLTFTFTVPSCLCILAKKKFRGEQLHMITTHTTK